MVVLGSAPGTVWAPPLSSSRETNTFGKLISGAWLILPRALVLAAFDGFPILMVCYFCYLKSASL